MIWPVRLARFCCSGLATLMSMLAELRHDYCTRDSPAFSSTVVTNVITRLFAPVVAVIGSVKKLLVG